MVVVPLLSSSCMRTALGSVTGSPLYVRQMGHDQGMAMVPHVMVAWAVLGPQYSRPRITLTKLHAGHAPNAGCSCSKAPSHKLLQQPAHPLAVAERRVKVVYAAQAPSAGRYSRAQTWLAGKTYLLLLSVASK